MSIKSIRQPGNRHLNAYWPKYTIYQISYWFRISGMGSVAVHSPLWLCQWLSYPCHFLTWEKYQWLMQMFIQPAEWLEQISATTETLWIKIHPSNVYATRNVSVMVPTCSDETKLRTFQGPFQDQISHIKDFYGDFHNADIPNIPHICGNILLFSFWDITSDVIGYLFYILEENLQNVHFGICCLLNW